MGRPRPDEMLIELELPYVDGCAGDLVLALGAPSQPGLGVLRSRCGVYEAELRLLGSSHQALIRAPGYRLSELVACQPGEGGSLPAHADLQRGGRRYEFRALVRKLAHEDYARAAASVVARLTTARDGLVGLFPGPADAFTALRFAPTPEGELAWETWHGYPQTGELVTTMSRVGAP